MKVLDLFCGAGGAGMGYARAGFEVVGVDHVPQPRYPFPCVQADALEFLAELIELGEVGRFDAIHASPPCQAYSAATPRIHSHPDLYGPTRELLIRSGLPYVIENVIGAPYSHGITLCGSMFGLEAEGEWIRRHRNFETSWYVFQPAPCAHPAGERAITITGRSFISSTRTVGRHSRQTTHAFAGRLMGIDWMTRDELGQAIPPAYTEWLGLELMRELVRVA